MMKIFCPSQSNKLYEKVLTHSKHKDLRMHVPSVKNRMALELNAWRGLEIKLNGLMWPFIEDPKLAWWLLAMPHPLPLPSLQVALVFLGSRSIFLEHLGNWQDKVKLRPLQALFLGWTKHHHLWPGQLLMSADGPSLCTRNSPSIWSRRVLLAVVPMLKEQLSGEACFYLLAYVQY